MLFAETSWDGFCVPCILPDALLGAPRSTWVYSLQKVPHASVPKMLAPGAPGLDEDGADPLCACILDQVCSWAHFRSRAPPC